MLADSQARLVLTDTRNLPVAKELADEAAGRFRSLATDRLDDRLSDENIGLYVAPTSLAGILYTSGSTGQPKGVTYAHRNLLNSARIATNGCHFCSEDRISLLASCSFGASVTDIFPPLLNGAAVLPFLFVIVSDRHERGHDTGRILVQTLAAILAVGLVTVGLLAVCGDRILLLRASWARYAEYAPFMWRLGLVATLRVAIKSFIAHECACRRFSFLRYYIPVTLGEVVLLYGALGWNFFKPWLPAGLWTSINALIGRDLYFIVRFMLTARILVATFIVVALVAGRRRRADSVR